MRSSKILIVVAVTALTGCAATDPQQRSDLWHPNGANDANLFAAVENPADLVHGRRSDGAMDALLGQQAVARLRMGLVKKLQPSDLAEIKAHAPEDSSGGPTGPVGGGAQ